jgi:hypothetical protein
MTLYTKEEKREDPRIKEGSVKIYRYACHTPEEPTVVV